MTDQKIIVSESTHRGNVFFIFREDGKEIEVIIDEEVEDFMSWWREQKVVPDLRKVRESFTNHSNAVLQKGIKELEMGKEPTKVLNKAIIQLTNKLLHKPTIGIKSQNRVASLNKANFEKINFGNVYPYRFDRRHNTHLAIVHRFNPKWELAGNWSYGTGLAFTAPINKYVSAIPGQASPPEVIINQPSKNNQRMPAYHRLDVSANYILRKKQTETKFTLGAYNAYNERHPLYFAYRRKVSEDNLFQHEFVVFELLPIMPVASISMKW